MITSEYGLITKEQVIAHVKTYQVLNICDRQASSVIVSLLNHSLHAELLKELKGKDYSVKVTVKDDTGNGVEVVRIDGVLVLYRLIGLVAVDTRATV